MKTNTKSFVSILKSFIFVIFSILSLLLPDIQLRGLVDPDIFSEKFVLPVSIGFTFVWIFLILFVCIFILPKKAGRLVYIITTSFFIILSLSQYIYFKIFEQFFWIKSIALAGEGAEYFNFAIKYATPRLVIFTLSSIISLVIAATSWRSLSGLTRRWWLLGLVFVTALCSLHISLQPSLYGDLTDDWDSWRKPRVVYKNFNDVNKSFSISGLYQFTFRDIFKTLIVPDEYGKSDFEEVDAFFAEKGEPVPNEYTSLFKGKNVIAVMLEGIDTWMIDKKYTPTICNMMEHGINFTNYHSPFFGTGHTFNAEFAFNTGFFTPLSAVSAVNFSSNSYPYALPKLFSEAGYSVNSFHYNDSEFYNRGIMHKSFGFEKYHSFTEFGLPETVSQADSNILKNDNIRAKLFEKKPFFNFIITYSGHVPYTFDDAKLALAKANHPELIDPSMDKEKNNCMILAADTDDFFKQLLESLEESGLLKDTVIIAFTDHYAYGFSDQQKLESYKKDEIIYRVPAFIYSCDMDSTQISKPMMTIDWLPTLVNLFGLNTEARYIGCDILSSDNPGFAYFGSSAWLDEKMFYNPLDDIPPGVDKSYIVSQNNRVKQSFKINDIIVLGDYYSKR